MPRAKWREAAEIGLAAGVVAYHLWLAFAALIPNLVSRPLHMALLIPWALILLPGKRRRPVALIEGALAVAGLAAVLWVVIFRESLDEQYGMLAGPGQYAAAAVLLLTVLAMARRAIGPVLPAVALLALAYGLFGDLLPGRFGHAGIPPASLLGNLTIAEAGIWGPLTGVSAGIVAAFVILGALLSAGEAGAGFMALAVTLAGGLRAGAAKVAVLASALFGSLSGSASANVASTGAVTLPMMKRLGYPPAFAAAVEAVASTGGQIMPPLMGAGAFVMVELLRIPYTRIMEAALLPAVLFFFACWIGIDLIGRRAELAPVPPSQRPGREVLLRTLPFFLVPAGLLLWLLLAAGHTPQRAAAWTVFVAAALLLLDRSLRPDFAAAGRRLADALVAAARQMATIASVILCAGIIIGVLNLTGLGVKITGAILDFSGGSLPAALVLTALACLALGMEVPTTAAYVIAVSIAGPALQELGLDGLLAHLFVFWYALLSTITPPVCGTVFIAAGMIGANWLATAGHAMRLGVGLYLVPLGFVADPALLSPLSEPLGAALSFLRIAGALLLLAWGIDRLRPAPGRGLAALAVAAALLLGPLAGR